MALRTLLHLCDEMERQYPTLLEGATLPPLPLLPHVSCMTADAVHPDDDKLLRGDLPGEDGKPAEAPLSKRQRMAVLLRRSDKVVLRECVQVIRAQWREYLVSEENVFAAIPTSQR